MAQGQRRDAPFLVYLTFTSLAFGTLAIVVLVPAVILLVQVTHAIMGRSYRCDALVRRPRVAVLVPAHNEASVVAKTIIAVLRQLASEDQLLVVADNCTDDTALIARSAGGSVVERFNSDLRGKNFALEYGIERLEARAPEVVVIVDADCEVHEGAIDRLAKECARTGQPVQALYLMTAPDEMGVGGKVAEFAWRVKNWVRPLGMRKMGLPCLLMGTGTAFPWRAIHGFAIRNSEMAEDYKFALDLARTGYAARFCPDAQVTSSFPARKSAEQTQRTRWEHGHLQLIMREVPSLLRAGVARRDRRLLALAVELMVPPLSFLALAIAGIATVSLVFALLSGIFTPLWIASTAAALFALAVSLAWLGWGRNALPAGSTLLAITRYVLAKIPVYVRFFTNRQRVWIKTERD